MPLNKSWHDYNESLIERGNILIGVSFLKSLNKEIRKMNDGKVGPPFEYSHTYIHLAFLKVAYRTVQGIVRGLSDYIKIKEMYFTHLRLRKCTLHISEEEILRLDVRSLNLDDDNDKPITLVVDVYVGGVIDIAIQNSGDSDAALPGSTVVIGINEIMPGAGHH